MILGVAVGLTVKQLTPWAATARRHAAAERIVLLAQKPEEYDLLHEKYGIEVIGASLAAPRGSREADDPVYVFKSRWRAISDFLSLDTESKGTDEILLTDTRDVIFQRYPIQPMTVPGEDFLVATEGVTFAEEPWNRTNLLRHFPQEGPQLLGAPIICAGVIQARKLMLQALAQGMTVRLKDRPGEADQMALNLILRETATAFPGSVTTMPTFYAWTAHLAQHPESQVNKHALRRTEPVATLNGTSVEFEGVPFAIVHQWTYLPALRALAEEA